MISIDSLRTNKSNKISTSPPAIKVPMYVEYLHNFVLILSVKGIWKYIRYH